MMKRVGYWLSEKKSRRFNFAELISHCSQANLDVQKIDLDKPLEDQGPFDVIFHKLTDVITSAAQGDVKSQAWIAALKSYGQVHPEVRILDPIDNVRQLLDRQTQYEAICKCSAVANNELPVFMPNFVELTTNDVEKNKKLLIQHNVHFPFLCKPAVANGSLSHQMSIIFNESGLNDVKPPCVAHSFINHNAVLYKVFVIGDQHFMVQRPSVKNLRAGDQKTIFFDSHHVSKPDSSCFLNELDELDKLSPVIQPSASELFQLAHEIQADLGLSLFGVDIIVENNNGRYALIDINAFPSYEGITGLYEALALLLEKAAFNAEWPPKDSHTAHYWTDSHTSTEDNSSGASSDLECNLNSNSALVRLSCDACVEKSHELNGLIQSCVSMQGIVNNPKQGESQQLFFPSNALHVPR